MPEPSDLDRSAVRRQFDRRAGPADPADFLLREIEQRMFERLDLVKLQPARLLDVGCGFGDGVRRLRGRWPAAQAIGVDLSARRVARAASIDSPPRAGWALGWARRLAGCAAQASGGPMARYLAGDAHRLPFAADTFDLLWSNLAFHWFDDVPAAIAEWHRVLRPGGLLMFSTLGVDSLRELRNAGWPTPVLPDLHDVGDVLVGAGFAEPVMDAERLQVTWSDPARLFAELRALGGDARRRRRRGLATPRMRARALADLPARLGAAVPSTTIPVTFEVVYGHAWIGERKRRADRWAPIEFRSSARGGKPPPAA